MAHDESVCDSRAHDAHHLWRIRDGGELRGVGSAARYRWISRRWSVVETGFYRHHPRQSAQGRMKMKEGVVGKWDDFLAKRMLANHFTLYCDLRDGRWMLARFVLYGLGHGYWLNFSLRLRPA